MMQQVVNETRSKTVNSGLDPQDTTAQNFRCATQRLRDDECYHVRSFLGVLTVASPTDVLRAVKDHLEKAKLTSDSFVVKAVSYAPALLKTLEPKTTMKKLGYRSMDSMLKHEPLVQLLAATLLSESQEWQFAIV